MDNEEFRRQAHIMVDWMADFMADVESLPVRAQVQPGQIAAQLPISPPVAGEQMDDIFADFKDVIMPGMTHWQHPNFFAYFPANTSPEAMLGEMLASTVGAQCMLWQTSPAATELETRMLEWLGQMIGMPPAFKGCIQDSASSSTLCAMLNARERASGAASNQAGMNAQAVMTVYTSVEAHSSVEKGARTAGFGSDNVRAIPSDENFAMDVDLLVQAINEDRAAGKIPACVIACLGSTGVGGVDPLRRIGEVCAGEKIFLHVDAAWAGSYLLLEEYRWMTEGLELVDSFVFNPHKLLLSGLECSALFVKDADSFVETFSLVPAYLKSREGAMVTDYSNWGIQLGRRFRAIRLWFVIRSYGVSGLQDLLRGHLAMADDVAAWLDAAPEFELMAARSFALNNFRYHPDGIDNEAELQRLNQHLLETLNDTGKVYFTQNMVRGKFTIRWNVGQRTTTARHVRDAFDLLRETARSI